MYFQTVLAYIWDGFETQFYFKGRGVQAQNFWKVYFELWVGGRGQDIYQQLEGGFGSINPILPIWGLVAKSGPKNQSLKSWDKASLLSPYLKKCGKNGYFSAQNRPWRHFFPLLWMGITRPFLSDFEVRPHQNDKLGKTNRMPLKS